MEQIQAKEKDLILVRILDRQEHYQGDDHLNQSCNQSLM